tara:strand:+ start:36298 stop:36645 length:348 start_codon:yes stop_codon:yes gene_type:complete
VIRRLKEGEKYYEVKYTFDEGYYKTYISVKDKSDVEDVFNNEYGSEKAPCNIESIALERDDKSRSIVVFTNVKEKINKGYSEVDAVASVSREFGYEEEDVLNIYIKVKGRKNTYA